MDHGPPARAPANDEEAILDAGFRLVLVLAGACLLLAVVAALGSQFAGRPSGGPVGSASATPTASAGRRRSMWRRTSNPSSAMLRRSH